MDQTLKRMDVTLASDAKSILAGDIAYALPNQESSHRGSRGVDSKNIVALCCRSGISGAFFQGRSFRVARNPPGSARCSTGRTQLARHVRTSTALCGQATASSNSGHRHERSVRRQGRAISHSRGCLLSKRQRSSQPLQFIEYTTRNKTANPAGFRLHGASADSASSVRLQWDRASPDHLSRMSQGVSCCS